MRCSGVLCRRSAALAAAVPPNYSNIPYKKVEKPSKPSKTDSHWNPSNHHSLSSMNGATMHASLPLLAPLAPPLRAANGATVIDPSSSTKATEFNRNHAIKSFRQRVCAATDVSMRPLLLLLDAQAIDAATREADGSAAAAEAAMRKTKYGEALEQLSCRWAKKFYGKVTFGPRNYPYPSSRWLARRFQMKKHRIVKRFRFRRYKLAAVANLPFAKMIRVGMLPELKSSKTKKGDAVDSGLSSQLVSAARSSSSTGKSKGKRTRPKSKYQV